jgi:predicted AAA+ superfamily ATPase
MEKMIFRSYWIEKIEEAWRRKPILWLSGVRRTGKTSLCHSLKGTDYFDCELPRTRRLMEDPEGFLDGLESKRIVLDEVHRLENPSELLKIAADHYPSIRVLATGSSTLGASQKFKDTLTGRKSQVWLTPLILKDLEDFKNENLKHRLKYGGLPPFFMADSLPEKDFQEWMDAYWAKDIQELFRLERRYSFQKFVELVMTHSGGIFEASKYTVPCEVSRSTIVNYLAVLEATLVAYVIRPYNTHRPAEIVSAPKVYSFDTGFVCYFKGWNELRKEDLGYLWEHFVLNEISARTQSREIKYWRDKAGREVDFIIAPRGHSPMAVECKWSSSDVDVSGIRAFRHLYPEGQNFIVANDVERPYKRHYDKIEVEFVSLVDLIRRMI